METTDFERDVIDRLARIETNAANAANLTAIVTLQGGRLDALEKRFQSMKDRVWSFMILGPLIVPVAVEYVRVHILKILFTNP